MIRLGTPNDIENWFTVDEGWLIAELHCLGCVPVWKDSEAVYFKKNNKLIKSLKKLDIDIEVD